MQIDDCFHLIFYNPANGSFKRMPMETFNQFPGFHKIYGLITGLSTTVDSVFSFDNPTGTVSCALIQGEIA